MESILSYSAKVILDSVSIAGCRLTTMEVTFPRFILAEMNTHRMFSRNSASSRAVPISKMIERVLTDPVMPLEWGKNRPGMQATEVERGPQAIAWNEKKWLTSRDCAVEMAEALTMYGTHKQIVNRLLEPFLWHTAIISATEWENFWEQRCSPLAQPEMRHTAELMRKVYTQSTPTLRRQHLPYLERFEANGAFGISETDLRRVSVARCARVSYLNHDGTQDFRKDLDLYEKLVAGKHLSPFEHVAFATDDTGFHANFRGWKQARKWVEEKSESPV